MWLSQPCYVFGLLLGILVHVSQLSQAGADSHLSFSKSIENDEPLSLDVIGEVLDKMSYRVPNLQECFTRQHFNMTKSGGMMTFREASRLLTKYINDKGCAEAGDAVSSEDSDPIVIIHNLRELGYEECKEHKTCFNEFTIREKNATLTDLIQYIYEGRCLLPDVNYFRTEYLHNFEDSNGLASRSGFNDFLKRLDIGKGNHAGHDHDDIDHGEHETRADRGNHGDDDEVSHEVWNTGDVHKFLDEIDGTYVDGYDYETDDGGHNTEKSDSSDHHGKDDSSKPAFSDGLDYERENSTQIDDHVTGMDESSTANHKSDGSKDSNQDGNQTEGAGNMEQNQAETINNEAVSNDAKLPNKLQEQPSESSAEVGDSNGDVLSQNVMPQESTEGTVDNGTDENVPVRRKRSSHLPQISRCYTSDQLMDIYEIDDVISEEKALQICPALIHQIKSDGCKSPDHHKTRKIHKAGYTLAMAYGYGTASVAIISLLALLGLALFPILESPTYKIIMQFFIGLAVGTLSSDALIHIIPQVLGVHDHDHGEDEEDKTFIWHMSVIFGGLYLVAGFESFLRAMKKCRSLAKHKKELSTYQDNPAIDNLPDESCPENAVTSFSCDVVSNNSLSKKMKPSVSDSEQMLPRHDIICCNFTPTLITVFIGDVLHNFADGLAIGVAFASHWSTGISTSIAILCHELPHEIGDFAIYLRNGASKWKAIGLNFTAACCNFIGLYSGINMASDEEVRIWLLCVVAGVFLYISLVQVMSTMLKDICGRPILQFFMQSVGMLLGWGIMLLIALYEDEIRVGN